MAEKEPCLIGSKITIRGQVSGSQDLVVEGRIEGRVALENRLTVEESGSVEAGLEVADAAVRGEVNGDLVASRSAGVAAAAAGGGDIRAAGLAIGRRGAVFRAAGSGLEAAAGV